MKTMTAGPSPSSQYAYELNLPNWVRWAMVFPAVILSRIALNYLILLYLLVMGAGGRTHPWLAPDPLILPMFLQLTGVYIAVAVSVRIAPTHHVEATAVVCMVVLVIEGAIRYSNCAFNGASGWLEGINYAVTLGGLVLALMDTRNELRKLAQGHGV